jgi:hypothetical protein
LGGKKYSSFNCLEHRLISSKFESSLGRNSLHRGYSF